MAQTALPHHGRPQVPQTTADLLEEIASLRRQNEEQRRELEHLRGDAVASPTGQPAQPTTMHRFNDFPPEIREMIWERSFPQQIVCNQDTMAKRIVPVDLHVPAVGQACRESRRIASSRNHSRALPGAALPSPVPGEMLLARHRNPTPAGWAWFSPRSDAVVVASEGFAGEAHGANHVLARAAEHVIVEDAQFWEGYYDVSEGIYQNGMYDLGPGVLLDDVTRWVHRVYATAPPCSGGEDHARACRLRTVDFRMREATPIHPGSPPELLRRLFGDATFKVVDLRDTGEFLRAVCHERSQGMDPGLLVRCISDLGNALDIYQSVADRYFRHLGPFVLKALAGALFEASNKGSPEGQGGLPTPFKPGGSKLNMEVAWVRELSERLTVRPVHVFVLGEDGSEDMEED
ncbi:hypothetical protein KVR01_008223 [Diaporthe batatas]|uniref:uncharacterized protein n=1 Tax=Diaporthe batatas TaxID=748121 RepID=UPI001D0398D7|nr:uncharacterized protein KVR01_008223 [Diaporthe batatas]KAG8162458.1 hypothetical protein KVR01_008223 [Diaporthe batatas]